MSVDEARRIVENFNENHSLTDEERFEFTEAMKFLIDELHDPRDMMWLGGYYYELREFDLALKYYEMAAGYDYDEAYECLGYIWYYGRTGTVDYEKAFDYFSKMMEKGNLVATYKVADMYKNGYFVEQDFTKYEEMIEDLYPKVKDAKNVFAPLPEVFTRLAKIYIARGQISDAAFLYLKAKDFLAQRIRYNAFFGNLNIMKWLVNDLYSIAPLDEDGMDLYDLYYILNEPKHVTVDYSGHVYHVESVKEDDACRIHFYCPETKVDEWYFDINDFFAKACIEDERITSLYFELYDWEVL